MRTSIVQVLVVLMFLANLVNAADYYVRPNEGEYGSENGSSYANAFDGFSDIDWTAVDADNDKLFVCGTFTAEQLVIGASGEIGTPIHIISCTTANGASTDDPGVIDGQNQQFTSFTGQVDADNKDYVIFDGIEVKNALGANDQYLMRFRKCSNITLQNCTIHDNEDPNPENQGPAGVNFNQCIDCLVANNEMYASGRNALYLPRSSDIVIEYNYIHDNPRHNAIDLHYNDGQLYSGIVIRYNELSGCTNGVKSQCQTNHEIYCNLIYEMSKSGIHFCDIGGLGAHTGTCKVYNNTIVDNTWDGIENDVAKNTTVKNNIFENGRYEISIDNAANQGHIIDYNLYGTESEWRASGTTYASLSSWYSAQSYDDPNHSFEASPGFADAVNDDYHLDSNSAAIDKGTNLTSEGITEDIEGNDRPQGSGFDIGAFESSFSVGVREMNEKEERLNLKVYPNPSVCKMITVNYELPVYYNVTLTILNSKGSPIKAITAKYQNEGKYSHVIDVADFPSGEYFCKIQTDTEIIVRKFILQ